MPQTQPFIVFNSSKCKCLKLKLVSVQSNRLSSSPWHLIGCDRSLLQQDHNKKKPLLSPTPILKVWSESFQMQSAALQLCWPRQAAGAGGGPGRGGAGPGRPAGLLVYWPPTESLAGWASSMERLIPAGTKSLPVVLLELQQQERSSESLQLILLYYYCSRTTTVVKTLSTHICVCVCVLWHFVVWPSFVQVQKNHLVIVDVKRWKLQEYQRRPKVGGHPHSLPVSVEQLCDKW